MIRCNLHKPFEVVFEKTDECPIDNHTFSFFRLVYVVSGWGNHSINDNKTPYIAGSLLLLTPNDYHCFEVESTTEFLSISFNNIFIKNNGFDSSAMQRIEYILQNANHNPGCILYNKSDKLLVKAITDSIVREHINCDLYSKDLVQQLVNTLIVIVARNIATNLPDKFSENTDEKAYNILQYIQQNIASPSKIRIDEIARHFGISESYVGRYFKKHTNETMQQYIANYRIKMIENRLLYSDMRITEIAFELGFTDESHLHKFFTKQKGVSPSQFRKSNNRFLNP